MYRGWQYIWKGVDGIFGEIYYYDAIILDVILCVQIFVHIKKVVKKNFMCADSSVEIRGNISHSSDKLILSIIHYFIGT